MPAATTKWDVVPIGYEKAQRRLLGYVSRCEHLQPLWEEIMNELEQEEETIFASLGGEFVNTGATMDSLTQPDATGAVREAHGDVLVFGSSIWYSIFLREDGTGAPSAVLVKPHDMQMIVTRTAKRYIEENPV